MKLNHGRAARGFTWILTGAAALAWGHAAHAAAPVLDSLNPAGGRQGTTVSVTAGGKFDPWPVQGWADAPGITIEAGSEAGKLTVRIDKDAPPGPHLVRLYNADGASAVRVFVVGEQPEAAEAEPNDETAKAQAVADLPVTVNGLLEKRDDVDSFAVKLDAGQCLVASLQGRRLGAPMDPMLHLYDGDGNQLAFAHDGYGLDPLLAFRAERPGTYVVRVSGFAHPPAADVRLTGGKAHVYRLSLTTGPFARYAFPSGVRRGEKSVVRLFGWNLPPDGGTREVDATNVPPGRDYLTLRAPGAEGGLRFGVVDVPRFTEGELGGGAGPSPARPPVVFEGRVARAGEEDSFEFAAKKGEKWVVSAAATAAGSPFDAVVRVEDAGRAQLARDDDGGEGPGDSRLEWTALADGTFRVVVSDLNHQGGEDFVYRCAIRPVAPEVSATVEADTYRVSPGKPATVKLTVTRKNGHSTGLVAVATGLPPGVQCAAADVPAKGGAVTLTLTAAADAKPAGGPFRILLLGTDPDRPEATPAAFDLTKPEGQQEYFKQTDSLWLTVAPDAPATRPAKDGG